MQSASCLQIRLVLIPASAIVNNDITRVPAIYGWGLRFRNNLLWSELMLDYYVVNGFCGGHMIKRSELTSSVISRFKSVRLLISS